MSKLERVIIPEILDSLDPADPRAVRSRWDLRWIDFYLGNSRWIVRQLKGRISGPARIMEIGAGEGSLCRKVHAALPSSRVTGLDLPTEADYESVGGFVFHHLGRIPVAGERFDSHGGRWEVLSATRNRVDLVRVTRLAPPD